MSKPNILVILADQLAADWVGCYGHPRVQTPHIDRLAETGVRFENAYCNSPICVSSRASFCSGQLVGRLGAFDNGTGFPASTPTFMHHLRRADYEVLLSGKMHFIGPDQMHGFQRRLTTDIYPSSFVWTPDWSRGACPNPGSNVVQLRTAGLCDWSLQLDYDEEVAFRALEALRDLARRRDEGRPFFLCASFTHPHDPFIITRQWWDLYAHADIDVPSIGPVPTQALHPYNQWLQVHHMIDTDPPEPEHVRCARHAYSGMVSYFDSKVGQLVDELHRLGLADDTIVVVTSDHGEMLGEHGMWFKRTYFDPSTRVPLICWGPNHVVSGLRCAQTVSLVDLYPTFLELSGLTDRAAVQDTIDGESLVGLLCDDGRRWKNYAICEYYSEGVEQPMRMAVRDRLKYVYVHRELPQLFDLTVDRHEEHNCIHPRSGICDDAAYADRLAELEHLVHKDWDPDAMRAQVLLSQQRRKWINEASQDGYVQAWDVEPDLDASRMYVRRHDSQETNERMRVPRVETHSGEKG